MLLLALMSLQSLPISARANVSGAKIESEGMDQGVHFKSEMEAYQKATLSLGVSYLGISLSVALNPAELIGKYRDFELNLNSYGRRFGFDIIYYDKMPKTLRAGTSMMAWIEWN